MKVFTKVILKLLKNFCEKFTPICKFIVLVGLSSNNISLKFCITEYQIGTPIPIMEGGWGRCVIVLKGENNLDKCWGNLEKNNLITIFKNMKKILEQLLKELFDKFKKKMGEIRNYFRKITVKGLKNVSNKLMMEKLGKN